MPKSQIFNVANTSFHTIPENKILKLSNLKYVLLGGMVAQLDNTLLVATMFLIMECIKNNFNSDYELDDKCFFHLLQ